MHKDMQLRMLMEQVPVTFFTLDKNLVITKSWGSGLAKQNRTPDQLKGLTLMEWVAHNDNDKKIENAHRLALKGKIVTYQKEWYGAFYEVQVEPLFDEAGEVTGTLSLCVDVSDRQHVEGALRESEGRLRAILDNTTAIITIKDKLGRYLHVNRRCCDLIGMTEDQLLKRRAYDVFPAETARHFEENDRLVFETGKLHQFEESILIDGTLHTYISIKFPLLNTVGEVYALCTMATEISERIEAEAFLREARQAAESANQAKTEFLANISHEIRTPIGAILGFAEILGTPRLSAQKRLECIETIHRNGHHLMELINDVLDLSKIESGELTLERIPFSIRKEIEDIVLNLKAQADVKCLNFAAHFEDNVPEIAISDPTRLRQILLNVISNAIKFTAFGSVTVKVRRREVPAGLTEKLEVVVVDTGCGIPGDKVRGLFVPFGQVDASITRNFGGTGLGLALSKRFANALGGDVVLTSSTVGVGSTFTITLDTGVELAHQAMGLPPKSIVPGESWDEENCLKSVKILLVEDGEDNQALFHYFLEHAGATVFSAMDGWEGIEMAHTLEPDLILMDIQMPHLDGYQATALLRKGGYPAPIVALTAHALVGEKEKCLAAGCNDYISKPVERRKLLRQVWNWTRLTRRGLEVTPPELESTAAREGAA